MEITAYWAGGMRVRVPVRGFELNCDEPARFGGQDMAPMPTELFLSSLASCYLLAVRHVTRKDGFDLPDLAVRVEGDYDGLRFSRIHIEVRSSEPRVRDVLERAVAYCYVSNTLREPPEMDYVMAGGPLGHEPPPLPS